jgi:hypothetical protein
MIAGAGAVLQAARGMVKVNNNIFFRNNFNG